MLSVLFNHLNHTETLVVSSLIIPILQVGHQGQVEVKNLTREVVEPDYLL